MITEPLVDDYLYSLLPGSGSVLAAMEAEAKKRNIPIVGPAVGHLLYLLAQMTGARRVFELGSAIGYSTLWWARAVGDEGAVYFTDSSPLNSAEAAAYFHRAGLQHRIHVLEGDALALLQATPGKFDIIFCDINKDQYPEALRQSLPRIKPGGLFVADNALWSGRVVHAAAPGDRDTSAIQEFNRMIYSDSRLFPVILPLRDGVAVCRVLPQ